MKKFLRAIAIIFAILLLSGGIWSWANWKYLHAFPHIISSFYSKEFCSCYFAIGRSEPFCHNYARQYVPIQEFSINEEDKSITVTGLWVTTTSEFVDKQYGCKIRGPLPK